MAFLAKLSGLIGSGLFVKFLEQQPVCPDIDIIDTDRLKGSAANLNGIA